MTPEDLRRMMSYLEEQVLRLARDVVQESIRKRFQL
jgi:hypothetical protein